MHKICRNNLRAFALRNYSEGYKINKPLFGLLVYRRIMPSAERLSSKFHSCPRSFASRPTVFIFWTIFQPWALSSDIPATERGLSTIYVCVCIYIYIYIGVRMVDNSVQRNTKNPQNMQERSPCVRLEKLFGGL